MERLESAASGRIGVDRRLIRSILETDTAASEALRFARSKLEHLPVDLEALLLDLFRHLQAPESLDFYVDLIRNNPEEIDDELVQAFLPFGAKAIGPLLFLYDELGEEQGADIAFLLAGLRVHDPRVLKILLERLEYDAADGAFCLGLYGDSQARPALEKMLAEVEEEDVELHREIAHALELLDAPEPVYTPEPFDVYAAYPERALPEFRALSRADRIAMTTDPDPEIRGGAWSALGDETEEDPALRDRMLARLTDKSVPIEERGGAAIGLYGVADRDDVREAIEELYALGGARRANALEAMWRSLWNPYAKYFAPHLEDPDQEIRRHALIGAGYFRLTAHLDKITACFDNSDLRDDALFAYALAMPGETTRGRVKGMLRKIDSIATLSADEANLVMFALDERLRQRGLAPVFQDDAPDENTPSVE